MTSWILAVSSYSILLFMILYTIAAFAAVWTRRREAGLVLCMEINRFLLHGMGYLTLYLHTQDFRLIPLYLFQAAFFLLAEILQRRCYKNGSRVLFENMLLLLSVGFVMIARLSFDKAVRQFLFAVVAMGVCLCLPLFVRKVKVKVLSQLGCLYAGAGIGLLLLVLFNGTSFFGAKNWLSIKGVVFQPSEFVKLLYLLALAALLAKQTKKSDALRVLLVSAVAAVHVGLLALANDFGGALIFFVLYVVMVLAVSGNLMFPALAVTAAVGAARLVYEYSGHVRERVLAWSAPFDYIENEGYQIAQSFFAIGNGGWFGTGLYEGMPGKIPVVTSDFIFAAISEEFGGIFAALLLCIYINCIIWMLYLALEQKEKFAFAVTAGAAALFGFQTFLNAGGVIKLIPSTGVTLPLVSYGGSSLISVLLLLQGTQAMQQEQKSAPAVWKEQTGIKTRMTALCAGMMLALCITVSYFSGVTVGEAESVFFNDYNPRVKALEQRMLRGKLLTLDGEILAQSLLGNDGTVYRVYPYGEAAAAVTGRVNYGETGLEKTEKEHLLASGLSEWEKFLKKAKGELAEGSSVVTTLDSALQKKAYEVLDGKRGAVGVMEVKTGRLLAMATSPTYNPNELSENWEQLMASDASPFLNRFTNGLYPPGSTFKIVTTLAYLKEHKAEEFTYSCGGKIKVGNTTLHCYNEKAHGKQTLKEAFANSCNTAYSYMSSLISPEILKETATELGFGMSFGNTLPYAAGSFFCETGMGSSLFAQTAFGQGKTLVSPVQILLLGSVIANGGNLQLPYFVERVETADGFVTETRGSQGSVPLLGTAEADYLTECMVKASEKYMREFAENGILVAGKTGSAEVTKDIPAHAWYVGFAPADAPEIAVVVLLERVGTGGAHAVPVAKELLSVYFEERKIH